MRWGWPDSEQYLKHFPSFVRAFSGKAFTHGSAYYIDDYAAAALWLPPNVYPDEDKLISLVQRTVSEQIQKDFFPLFEQMGRYHPSKPHWYLPLMGVDPSQQSKGVGSALLQRSLIQCDRDSKLAYLESSNPKNVPSINDIVLSYLVPFRQGHHLSAFQCFADLGKPPGIIVFASAIGSVLESFV